MINYILSSGNPGIEPVYYKIAIGIVILLAFATRYHCQRGRISKSQSVAVILLVTYIFLVFASTVFSRTKQDYYSYELTLFWSYREIWAGSQGLFWEDVLNVVLLFPMGVLLPVVFGKSLSSNKKMFTRVILLSFLTSLTIEVLQLIFKCGLFEFDDLFHNTLGATIGYWLSQKLKRFNKFVRSV